jgi:hypothetical protein
VRSHRRVASGKPVVRRLADKPGNLWRPCHIRAETRCRIAIGISRPGVNAMMGGIKNNPRRQLQFAK